MRCIKPITIGENVVNCGHCYACRVNYTTEWALRLIYELSTNSAASFLTLTYDNEHYPIDCGLHKEDLQKFFKRLRINIKRKYHEFAPKIRYYGVGEYGSRTKRSHYHAIVFGLDNYNDEHRDLVRKSWTNCEPWLFDKDRGRKSAMQEVTPEDIAYVTGYVQKKLSGELAKEEYGEKQPPFSICSQGLGLDFALKNRERLINNGFTFFKGHRVGIPRYFCQKFDVRKGDLLNIENNQVKINENLFSMFVAEMKKRHIWNIISNNNDVIKRQYEKWYDDYTFNLADHVFKDFQQRQKLRGGL